jgi:hypothetical protein
MLLIKIQVWRGDQLISHDACPVHPGNTFTRSLGALGLEPIVEGNVALCGYTLTQDTTFLDETPNEMLGR